VTILGHIQACPTRLLAQISGPFFFFFFFGCFCRKFCHADVDSREQQAILLKKVENFSPKLRFSCFFGEILARFCHAVLDFRANIKGSLWTNLTAPDRLRCRTKTDGEYFSRFLANSFFEHRQK
jgi:hypothetical protein